MRDTNSITLVIPPTNPDGQLEDYDPREPLGILYLSAVLRKNGYRVSLINADMMGFSVKKVTNEILLGDSQYIGFSVVQRSLPSFNSIIKSLRSSQAGKDLTVVVGGHQPTLTPGLFFEKFSGIDYVVVGDGEFTLLDLINNLRCGKDPRRVSGICYQSDNVVINTELREKIGDLDSLPFPSRDFLRDALHTIGFASLVSSRGCFGNCSFCGISEYLKRSKGPCWRGRSPGNVVDEIEYLLKEFGVKTVKFNDDEMFGPGKEGRDRVVKICEEIMRRKIKVKLLGYCRVTDVEESLFKVLKRAGFCQFLIGVESFSQEILDKYRKGVLVEHNFEAIRILRKLRIGFTPGFMPFCPYTTLDTLINDFSWMRKYKLFTVTPSKSLTIHQGTPIEHDVEKMEMLVKQNPILGYDDYYVDSGVDKLYYVSKWCFLNLTKSLKTHVFDCVGKLKLTPKKRRFLYDSYRKCVWMLETKMLIFLAKRIQKNLLDNRELNMFFVDYLVNLKIATLDYILLNKKLGIGSVRWVNKLFETNRSLSKECVDIVKMNNVLPIVEKYVWDKISLKKLLGV